MEPFSTPERDFYWVAFYTVRPARSITTDYWCTATFRGFLSMSARCYCKGVQNRLGNNSIQVTKAGIVNAGPNHANKVSAYKSRYVTSSRHFQHRHWIEVTSFTYGIAWQGGSKIIYCKSNQSHPSTMPLPLCLSHDGSFKTHQT